MGRLSTLLDLEIQRGATWQDAVTYVDSAGEGIDLTGYSARLQIRTLAGRYGVTTATTLILELTDVNGLSIGTPSGQTVPCEISIDVGTDAIESALNVDNSVYETYAYALEAYDDSVSPEVVFPITHGTLTVRGETVR